MITYHTSGSVVIGTTSPTAKFVVTGGQVAIGMPSTLSPTGASPAQTLDWNNGNIQFIDISGATGTVSLTLNNPAIGASYVLKIKQGASSTNVSWPGTVKWPGGVTPTITTTSGAFDVISMFYDGTSYYASSGKDYR